MQNRAETNHISKLLALTLLVTGTCMPFAHAEQDYLGKLENAITYENVAQAKAALAGGIDWSKDGHGDHQWSALDFAVGHTSSNGVEILKLVLASKADVNAKAEYRQTPLHFAAEDGNTVALKLLVGHGADVPIPPCGAAGRLRLCGAWP